MSKSVNIDDDVLIQKYFEGETKSITELYNRYNKYVYYYILKNVRNKVVSEDLTQDVWVKIFNKFKKKEYNFEGKFQHFLTRVATTTKLDYFRRNKHHNNLLIKSDITEYDVSKYWEDDKPNIESKTICDERKDILESSIQRLKKEKPHMYSVIELLLKGYKHHEIAEELDIKVNTSLGLARYARKYLKQHLNKHSVHSLVP